MRTSLPSYETQLVFSEIKRTSLTAGSAWRRVVTCPVLLGVLACPAWPVRWELSFASRRVASQPLHNQHAPRLIWVNLFAMAGLPLGRYQTTTVSQKTSSSPSVSPLPS